MMVLKDNTLLYFSGTGNSLQVAKDICKSVCSLNLLKLATLRAEEKIVVESEILGIVFPVYYSRLPLVVERIIKKLEVSKNTYFFAVATHGGAPATVLKKLEAMLKDSGALLNAGFLIRMPKNHILEYNSKPAKIGDKIFNRETKKICKISNIIKEKRNCKCEISRLIIDTAIDKVFISATDKIMQNLNMVDSEFWVNDNCSGCKLCQKVCSVNNINFETKPVWTHKCERCMACIQLCPNEAIQWGNKTAQRQRYKNPNIDIKELT